MTQFPVDFGGSPWPDEWREAVIDPPERSLPAPPSLLLGEPLIWVFLWPRVSS